MKDRRAVHWNDGNVLRFAFLTAACGIYVERRRTSTRAADATCKRCLAEAERRK